MSGKNIFCTSWCALWNRALPLLSIRATPHLFCPSHTCFYSQRHYLHPPCLLFLAALPCPFPCTHSPEGLVPSPKPPGPERRGLGEWGNVLTAPSTARAAGSNWGPGWAALTAPAGAASRGMLLAGSNPICAWSGGSFRGTPGHVPSYSPTLGSDLPRIYRQGNSPSCFSFSPYKTPVTIFTLLLHRSIFRIN